MEQPQKTLGQQPPQQWWEDHVPAAATTASETKPEHTYQPEPLPSLSGEARKALGVDVGREVRTSVIEDRPIDPSTYSALESLGYGWKAHLNFDSDNPAVVARVDTTLQGMQQQGSFATYKIGKGGGKEAGQPGKESTVYIGSRTRLNQVATELEASLGDVLLAPDAETLKDDEQVGPLIAARFDVHGIDHRIGQYGAQGHGLLKGDLDPWNQTRSPEAAADAAQATLTKTYGEYFTG